MEPASARSPSPSPTPRRRWRAAALGAETGGDPPGPGELAIAGLRGVGGSLLRLVDAADGTDRLWQVDFSATGAVPAGAGLTGVDHVAQTMRHDEMLSWSLFYTALLDAEKAPMVDVADPDGLVRSQAIRSGRLRITLNGAEPARTLASRFLSDSFGAATQHVAFASADIFATADRLAALGFRSLPIGANYYDDLATRFDLAADLLARLKARNILYDGDLGGAFFQLYSRPFGDGLFIEIVHRRGAYQGYGAPNAPFRIAAQKRLLRPVSMPKR
jgi:4-hydroxyphenylpyruvate dioxygenase